MDIDGDGRISFEEFKAKYMLFQKEALTKLKELAMMENTGANLHAGAACNPAPVPGTEAQTA